ncbi:MAG: ATP-binding cassette domain-containing protein [Thermomicrobium sp.]|nr:ATP-binding cassette domain-containing protein [Thermomicrobium sp.]MDW7982164.1 ATP-binding cassette domain-containing protein [Thermomicrobium sp.]
MLAVKDVSFSVAPGEIVAVVGESGSGKSTLARLILRLLPPTSGTIRFAGLGEITRLRGRALRHYWQQVQAIFQDPFSTFNQFLTVRRLLERSLGIVDNPPRGADRECAIAQALQSVGLEPSDVLPKWPHQLSGGQRQRVMIARALLLQPKLVIADEPTSMLDASLRVTVLNLLADLRQRGSSVLFITHDLGQAFYLADRLLVMYQGEIVERGPVEAVLRSPRHPYTQRLLADVPRLGDGRPTARPADGPIRLVQRRPSGG